MGDFLPLFIKLIDGKTMSVSSICDAEIALKGQWRNKQATAYKDACRLIASAKDGICKPSVAFSAFKAAALGQGLVQRSEKSAALRMLDEVSKDIQN